MLKFSTMVSQQEEFSPEQFRFLLKLQENNPAIKSF
jgi:hypothetical protein